MLVLVSRKVDVGGHCETSHDSAVWSDQRYGVDADAESREIERKTGRMGMHAVKRR
jgi:hypothetical protein